MNGIPSTTEQLRRAGRARTGTWLLGGLLTVVTTAALAGVAGWWERDSIESDLTERAGLALREHGLSPEGIAFHGRDATLYGSLAHEQAAFDVLNAVRGVRSVNPGHRASGQRASAGGTSTAPVSRALGGRVLSTAALRERINQIQAEQPILFPPDSTALPEQAAATVSRVADLLQKSPQARIEVAGHAASSAGATDTDVAIAARRRAATVHDALAERGVSPERMHAQGYGDSRPKGTDDASRRVEIIVR